MTPDPAHTMRRAAARLDALRAHLKDYAAARTADVRVPVHLVRFVEGGIAQIADMLRDSPQSPQ